MFIVRLCFLGFKEGEVCNLDLEVEGVFIIYIY